MGISFLSPLLLGGLALVAAPIILHLVMRRKPVPHPFPALRFLQERALANRRRLQLSHLLLLLLRIAALVLLAAALARPVLRGAGWLPETEGPVAAAFVFDTAPRMMLREGNQTRLEQAAALARVLFGKLPAESQVAVFDTAGTPAALLPAAAAQARLDRLSAAPPSVSLPAAIAAGRRLLERAELQRRELYVFTDCSQGAWANASAAPEAGRETGISTLFVDVGSQTPRNVALESVELSGERLAAGTPLVVAAAVSRTAPAAGRPVAVEIGGPGGRLVRRAVQTVTPEPGRPETVRFEIGGLAPGIHQGRVVLDGSDDLAADDQRAFTVAVGQPARVIVAAARPAPRAARFLVEAIAPTPLRKAGTARFLPEPVEFAGLDATDWQRATGMVLLDPPPLADRDWETLAAWVAEGRGLVVWLGPAAGTAAGFNSPASRQLLGGELVRVWRSPDAGNYLAPAALDHPLLAAFRRVGDEVPWQDFPVYRHWEFLPSEPAEGGDPAAGSRGPAAVVASYRNGLPAVLEHRVGQGTVVVVTTPVGRAAGDPEAWNLLATGFEPWPFLMLANETLLHAIDTAEERNVIAGRPVTLRLGRRDVPTALVHTPAGDDFPVAIDRTRGTVTVTATLEPGNYTVRAGGGQEGVADGFSVTLDPTATDFRRLSPEQLRATFGPDQRLARTEEELVRDVNLERIGSELFGWAILLAALAMAADWIVANRFYRPKQGIEPPADAAAEFEAAGEDESARPPAAGWPPAEQGAAGRSAAAGPPPRRAPPPLPPTPPPLAGARS
jgi:hypothetical protein